MVLPEFQQRIFALTNPNRIKIYDMCLKEKLNITQISQKLKQSYKSVLNNIRILEEAKFIKREKIVNETSQESIITSIPLDSLPEVIKSIYKEIKKE